jgi:hypothetical protein
LLKAQLQTVFSSNSFPLYILLPLLSLYNKITENSVYKEVKT